MRRVLLLLVLFMGCGIISCREDILEQKPDKALVVPQTLSDMQGLLDNGLFRTDLRGIAEIASGDYYIESSDWTSLRYIVEKNAYAWEQDVYEGATAVGEWNNSYKQVFYANVALEGLNKITPESSTLSAWNNVKGTALFFRAYAFYNLTQVFASPFRQGEDTNAPGIPLRLNSNLNEESVRAGLEETYRQILQDLHEASELLSEIQKYRTRPSKAAAFALMARVYLAIEDYDQALHYANACLQLHSMLLDFNELDAEAPYPVPLFNDETILLRILSNYASFRPPVGKIDTSLDTSYSDNDLRKVIFFRKNEDGTMSFRGSYHQSSVPFSGLATDEVYLIRAECYARTGNVAAAMEDVNTLLEKRWKAGTFFPFSAQTAEEALSFILKERRKELVLRGLRWSGLRRLNKDARFSVTLTRKLNGETITLLPGDPRYVFPIPDYIIDMTGMQQNPR